jgi:hypothetical protein
MYMKKMAMPKKQEAMPPKRKPKEEDMALELEIEEGESEEPEMEGEELDLKSMMGEGESEEGGMLAEVSDDALMAELKKRGLMPEGAAAPEAAMPKMK